MSTVKTPFYVRVESTPEGLQVHVGGVIDEHSDFSTVYPEAAGPVIFDLSNVVLINSIGIREWVKWMKKWRANPFIFRNCPKVVVDQINILEGFLPSGAVIESFFVPYYCEPCDKTERLLFKKGAEFEKGTADVAERLLAPHPRCPTCGAEMEMDVTTSKYFHFLKYRRSA